MAIVEGKLLHRRDKQMIWEEFLTERGWGDDLKGVFHQKEGDIPLLISLDVGGKGNKGVRRITPESYVEERHFSTSQSAFGLES